MLNVLQARRAEHFFSRKEVAAASFCPCCCGRLLFRFVARVASFVAVIAGFSCRLCCRLSRLLWLVGAGGGGDGGGGGGDDW